MYTTTILQIISAVDTDALGRADYSTMSPQTLMELLIQSSTTSNFVFEEGDVLEIEKWEGVKLDSSGDVTEIEWPDGLYPLITARGRKPTPLDLRWLPPTLQRIHIGFFNSKSDFDAAYLPRAAQFVWLLYARMKGVFGTYDLPRSLEYLWLMSKVSGSIECAALPQGLRELFLGHNWLTGTLDCTKLPTTLAKIDVSNNYISGPLDSSKLPPNLVFLKLNNNSFGGEINIPMACLVKP